MKLFGASSDQANVDLSLGMRAYCALLHRH